jgi:hypothetical protein
MSMSQDDYSREQAIHDLCCEEKWKKATQDQPIYLFVEGDSEEQALPILLESAGIDLQEIGIVIANYNGIGNLPHALSLLNKTLSNDRPIVLTLDNDMRGKEFLSSKAGRHIDTRLVTVSLIPDSPVVEYTNGHKGGSFEEAFALNHFIETCFLEGIMHDDLVTLRTDFEKNASSFSKCELSSPAGALSIITPGANVKPSHYRWNAVNSGGFGGLAPHFHNKSEATKIFKC